MSETEREAAGYVLKEVFDARMDRMETLMEKTLLEIKADNERLRSELKGDIAQLREETRGDIAQLRSEVKVLAERGDQNFAFLNARIDGVQHSVYWCFATTAILIGLMTFYPMFLDSLRRLRKPQVTLDQVQELINAALEKGAPRVEFAGK